MILSERRAGVSAARSIQLYNVGVLVQSRAASWELRFRLRHNIATSACFYSKPTVYLNPGQKFSGTGSISMIPVGPQLWFCPSVCLPGAPSGRPDTPTWSPGEWRAPCCLPPGPTGPCCRDGSLPTPPGRRRAATARPACRTRPPLPSPPPCGGRPVGNCGRTSEVDGGRRTEATSFLA